MSMERYITLSDGTGMGGELIIFKTDAPVELLKQLEALSCEAVKADEDVPIWKEVVTNRGFEFKFIDSHQHVTAFGTSQDWLKEHAIGSKVTEHYVIDDQPNL